MKDNRYIADGAVITGDVVLGIDTSVFFNAVLRGDINSIVIGEKTNIQDNCTIHVSSSCCVVVGCGVTIGHGAIIHACTIGDNVIIGMGAIVMDGAIIGDDSIVAAGSLVPPGKSFAPGTLVLGNPAKDVRSLTEEEIEGNRLMAAKYVLVKNKYLEGQRLMKDL